MTAIKRLLRRVSIVVAACCAVSASAQSLTLPFTENFDGPWAGGGPSNYPKVWTKQFISGTANWVQYLGGLYETPSNTSYNALFYQEDWSEPVTRLITPALDITGYEQVTLSFRYCAIEWAGDQDYLSLEYRVSSNGTWNYLTNAYTVVQYPPAFSNGLPSTGNPFDPGHGNPYYQTFPNGWSNVSFVLPSASTQYFVAFRGYAYYGFGICVDDVAISGKLAQAAIGIDSNALAFSATYNGANPAVQPFTITNTGSTAYTYTNTVTYGAGGSGWFSVAPSNGTITGFGSQATIGTVNIAGLGAGTYCATNIVTSATATNSPQFLPITLTVNKADQAITFPAIPDQETTDAVGLSAASDSGLAVSFAVGSGPGTIAGGTNLTFTGPGIVSITASQAGNADWAAAPDETVSFVVGTYSWTDWEQINVDGFGDTDNFSAFSLALYNGVLYAGTWNNTDGCEVWRLDGPGSNDWTRVASNGFGKASTRGVHCMEVYNGRLYAGVANNSLGFEVWAYDETNWTQVADVGLGTDSTWAQSMAVLDGKLYMGSGWGAGARIWTYDGSTWTQINTDGFGDSDNQSARSLASYNGHVYAGVYNTTDYCNLYRYDGPTAVDWTLVADGSVFDDDYAEIRSLAAYDGKLYIGTAGWSASCEVWEYDGSTFTQNDPGASLQYDATRCMTLQNNLLYVGTGNDSGTPSGGQVWAYNAALDSWTKVNSEGFGNAYNEAVHSLAADSRRVYAGVSNSDGDGGKVFSRRLLLPEIVGCAPTSGLQSETLDLTIAGVDTHFENGVSAATFSGAGITVNSTTVANPTSATANITIDADAAPGARDVTVNTGAENPYQLTGGFTVVAVTRAITVEAEDFDAGGEGVAYHDTTPGNIRGGYRPAEDVDIAPNASASNGFNVGYAVAGEWLNYTVDVPSNGTYVMEFVIASFLPGGTFHVEFGGADRTGTRTAPDTGAWTNWQTMQVTGVVLTAGEQVMRLALDNNGPSGFVGNFDQIRILPQPGGEDLQSPYGGTAYVMAGAVQCEDYDWGGSGVAYYDTTPGNIRNSYRNGDVDVGANAGAINGYNVGFTAAGEWLEYTVDVGLTGTYNIQVRVSCKGEGGTFRLLFDGVDKTGIQAVPNTGSWTAWQTVTINGVDLVAGEQVMRLELLSVGSSTFVGNFDQVELIAVSQTPYGGSAHAIPGSVQCEDYDLGGTGVAYRDGTTGNTTGAYRNDDVDIALNVSANNSHNVGYATAGEWLEYTVDVASGEDHNIGVRVACGGGGGTFRILFNGSDKTGIQTVPDTGGWAAWQMVVINGVNLSAGQQVMRLELLSVGSSGYVGNFDDIQLSYAAPPPVAPVDWKLHVAGGPDILLPEMVLTGDDVEGEESPGWLAVDGNEDSAWIGEPEAGGWWIVLKYKELQGMEGVELLLTEAWVTEVLMLGSLDAEEWYDIRELFDADLPAEFNYLWLIFPADGTGASPEVKEILLY